MLVLIGAQTAFAQLSIQSIAPVYVKTGDKVTITGNGISATSGGNLVSFNTAVFYARFRIHGERSIAKWNQYAESMIQLGINAKKI